MNPNAILLYAVPQATPGSKRYTAINQFCSLVVEDVVNELQDFNIDVPVYGELSKGEHFSIVKYAQSLGAHLALKFTLRRQPQLKTFPSRPFLTYAKCNNTTFPALWLRYLEHWGLSPRSFVKDDLGQNELSAAANGTHLLTLCLGSYSNWSDLGDLEKQFPKISKATARALTNYLWPLFFGKDSSTTIAKIASASEVSFCNASQQSPIAAKEEGLIP